MDLPLQRAQGDLRISFKRRGEASVLDDLRQEGSLKARFPRSLGVPEAVLLNNAGGIAGGDRLTIDLAVADQAKAMFTTAAAERVYRALAEDAPAHIRTKLTVGEGAEAEYLPQETILFDTSALDRRLDIQIAETSRLLAIETLLLGRQHSGESLHQARIAETITLRRGQRLVLHDAIRLHGPLTDLLARKATMNGATALATLIHAAPDAESRLEQLRAACETSPAETGASAWDGMLLLRILARDGAALRATLLTALSVLRGPRPLPRVWTC